ncbi:ABC transporter substrate-binding protein [Bosea sp. (in: a-proteobacteria)]|uniref:ABC transporter substrate-binding protein n=1 Tax=Bosea sp. (in: a-proteobacteria) TaxID=1871050 RepID=UPI002DDCE16A|nr:ABC transporter substrate-binding protein [Bosea sp. (in: a-proteobacteria)]HEV2508808.1 ABC transporter substrate-binding protein [Bosea sp. (in: a-proteobacteria)]
MNRSAFTRRMIVASLASAATIPMMQSAFAQAGANAPVTIGFITTLSTPAGYIGEDIRAGFQLALTDGKLGGVPVILAVEDDALKPANAKQAADRLIQSGVKLFTGVNFSNVLAAVVPGVLESGGYYVSLNPGPSSFAGERCHRNYFVASYQNDAFHEAAGLSANRLGYKRVALLAPNYQAGRDALEGFKRTFKGEIVGEIYTKLDQTDFSVELARVRSLAPEAIYQFHPGGAGINFAKQYANAGLGKSIPMLIPAFSMDAHMVGATGDAADGIYASALWTPEATNPASKAFVDAFRKAYSRTPTMYAQQAYDTANLIGSALKAVNGDIGKQDEFRKALLAAQFTAVRGKFSFGPNQHPVQDYYLTKFEKRPSGEIVQTIVRKIAEDYGDAYAAQCKLN